MPAIPVGTVNTEEEAVPVNRRAAILGMREGDENMRFFDFIRQPDINQGVTDCQNIPGAVLLDVRTPQEYREGHILGSKNVPLQALDTVRTVAEQTDTELFVYCYSGTRSRQAVAALKRMGYTNVHNIGGISAYRGKVEQ